jgi:UDP-N-acetyl-D-mannosaminuronate dehydrogenase
MSACRSPSPSDKNFRRRLDLSAEKVRSYNEQYDPTIEVSTALFKEARLLNCTNDPTELRKTEFVIVAVPTPVDVARMPDFEPLRRPAGRGCSGLRRRA